MATLIVKLKQHTPIIHFQAHQNGATLRASDLMPRLKKYINYNLLSKYYTITEEMRTEIQKVNHLVKRKKPILPKVEIQSVVCEALPIKAEGYRTLYFGDITRMRTYSSTTIAIRNFNPATLKIIPCALQLMFAFENFGARENKGYGSFTIEKIMVDDSEIELITLEDIYKKSKEINTKKNIYYFNVTGDCYDVFKSIFYFYNSLKAGVNEDLNPARRQQDKYSKSLLWRYLNENKVPLYIWEKRLMKKSIEAVPPFNNGNILENENNIIMRVLLGMSTDYKFSRNDNVRMDTDYGNSSTLNIRNNKNFKVTNSAIACAPSPIFFKPIQLSNNNYRVYIILKPELYFDGEIDLRKEEFTVSEKIGINTIIKGKLKTLETFDLKKFMDWVITTKKDGTKQAYFNKFIKEINIEELSV